MGYKKATDLLPDHLLDAVQHYVDGEYLYIPRKDDNKKSWGEKTRSKQATLARNKEMFDKFQSGCSVHDLTKIYFLSAKTIYRILAAVRS